MFRKISSILLILLILISTGCHRQQAYTTYYYDYFDTFSYLTVYAEESSDAQNYAKITEDVLISYHQWLNCDQTFEGVVNLAFLNELPDIPVQVDPELMDFLEYAVEAYELSSHKVNIAIGAVSSLWKEQLHAENPVLPDPKALEEAGQTMDLSLLMLDSASNIVTVPEGMKLDAGALAKGYVASILRQKLLEAGCESALLNLGGNVMCIGDAQSSSGKGWNIGIANPFSGDTEGGSSSEDVLMSVQVLNASLVTSGDYERYFLLDGVRYHHIIDPDTLYPGTRYRSVSILCADDAAADLLSTALFLLDEEEGLAIAAHYQARVIYVYPDGTISDHSC